jgi:hypothetical protein
MNTSLSLKVSVFAEGFHLRQAWPVKSAGKPLGG